MVRPVAPNASIYKQAITRAGNVHSPMFIDNGAMSPTIDQSLLSDMTPAPDRANEDPLSAILSDTLPLSVKQPSVATPADELPSSRTLDNLVGAHIDPIASTTSLSSIHQGAVLKSGPGLQLPSFELLGIANPRPDRSPSCPAATPSPLRQRLSDPLSSDSVSALASMGLGGLPFDSNPSTPARALSLDSDNRMPLPIQCKSHVIETLTPPEDKSAVLWSSLSAEPEAMAQLSDASGQQNESLQSTQSSNQEQSAPQLQTASSIPRIELHRSQSDFARTAWLDNASNMIMMNMRSAEQMTSPVKVLSHALPCPSPSGFAFPFVISSLQTNTPGSPLCWINVFHALPGKFNLSDLPTSPPTTPGPPVGGDDYFTSKTFDSAVPVLDYQDNLVGMPRSPHPIVPPSTIGVSIVERYIPPTNANEFTEMFDVNGRSLLLDRLLELHPNNGSLLFIYPTKAGAETFMRDYLGPILDPFLRSLRTIHGLPVDLCTKLGRMPAVSTMHDYDSLRSNIEKLCATIGQQSRMLKRFGNGKATFSLELAQKQSVRLDRAIWAEKWWTKQEKTRIRDDVTRYFRMGNRTAEQTDITATSLIHSILDGVSTRPYAPGREPTNGVEIGLFVIKRTV